MSDESREGRGSSPDGDGGVGAGRVLVVDDSVEIRDLLAARLGAEGYQVELAEDGQRALRVAAKVRPDVVICDLVMPVMGGQEFCRRARADATLRGCYIIVLTARDSREDLLKSLSEGADDFLVKPWDTHELMARIRTGMRIRSLQQQILFQDRRDTLAKLAVTAAHEINNPLTGLVFELQLTQGEADLSPGAAKGVERALALAKRIGEIVEQLTEVDVEATTEYAAGVKMYELKGGNKDGDASGS